jgi:Protein of unknown function (DUF4031)
MKFLCDRYRHLVCSPYSIENLHKMADELKIKRCWFHKDHYDIPKRRIVEIHAKCRVVSSTDIWTTIHGPGVEKYWKTDPPLTAISMIGDFDAQISGIRSAGSKDEKT